MITDQGVKIRERSKQKKRKLIMNYAILLSGGTGTRTGSEIPKQYVRRNGHMMITEALGALLQSPQIDKVVITADEAW